MKKAILDIRDTEPWQWGETEQSWDKFKKKYNGQEVEITGGEAGKYHHIKFKSGETMDYVASKNLKKKTLEDSVRGK